MQAAAVLPSVAPSRFRLAGWMLVAQFLCWPALIAAALSRFPLSEFDTWTAPVFADVQGPWIMLHLLLSLAYLLGCGGLFAAAYTLRTGPARAVALATLAVAAVTILLVIAASLLRMTIGDFDAATLGEVRAYQVSDSLFSLGDRLGMLTTALGALSLWQAGRARWTALVVAVLGGLLLVASFFMGFPPAVTGVLWLVLGVALLFSQRQR